MIRDRGVALRYVHALFGAAKKRGEAAAVLDDLESIARIEETDVSVQKFLESPSVLDHSKERLVERAFEGKVRPLVVQFLLLMLRKRRIGHFPLVLDAFRKLVEEDQGIVEADVRVAAPITEEQIGQMKDRLARLTGKQVAVRTRVEPLLLGGVVVLVGGRIIDGSIRHRLQSLREELLATEVL